MTLSDIPTPWLMAAVTHSNTHELRADSFVIRLTPSFEAVLHNGFDLLQTLPDDGSVGNLVRELTDVRAYFLLGMMEWHLTASPRQHLAGFAQLTDWERQMAFGGHVVPVRQLILTMNRAGHFWFTGTTHNCQLTTAHFQYEHLFDRGCESSTK
jgi:hypothetical protein